MDIIYSDLKEQELNLLKNKIQSRLKISHCLVVIFLIGALLDEILLVFLIKAMNKKGKWDLRIVIQKQKRECAIMYEFELPTEALINIEDKIFDFRFIDEKFEKMKGEI